MDKNTNVATIQFEWHKNKADSNQSKHGLSFELEAMVFLDPSRIEAQDTRANYGENRWKTLGVVQGSVLCVVYTVRDGDTIRLISGRYANAKERQQYDQAQP
ncbi:MAG: BrnT family toxin [Pseudomonadota bacterium]